MASAVNTDTKIVPIQNYSVETTDTTTNKILRTVGSVLSKIGEYTFKAAIPLIALIGIFVLTIGAPISILAFPLYLIMASTVFLISGKGLENFNEKKVEVLKVN